MSKLHSVAATANAVFAATAEALAENIVHDRKCLTFEKFLPLVAARLGVASDDKTFASKAVPLVKFYVGEDMTYKVDRGKFGGIRLRRLDDDTPGAVDMPADNADF